MLAKKNNENIYLHKSPNYSQIFLWYVYNQKEEVEQNN